MTDEFGQSATSFREGGQLTVFCKQENTSTKELKLQVWNATGDSEELQMTDDGILFKISNEAAEGDEKVFPGGHRSPAKYGKLYCKVLQPPRYNTIF